MMTAATKNAVVLSNIARPPKACLISRKARKVRSDPGVLMLLMIPGTLGSFFGSGLASMIDLLLASLRFSRQESQINYED